MDNDKITNLTVNDLKILIQNVVSEELAKRYVNIPVYYTPYQPHYCPYETTRVTCDTHTKLK